MTPRAKLRLLLSAANLCVAGSWPSLAQAEEEFPGALAEAADMACVPTCLMCHTVNPGTASTWSSKPLPLALMATGKIKLAAGDVDGLNEAWKLYAADPANAAHVALIKQGREPKAEQDVCGPKYGCGATLAHTPSRGASGSSATVVGALSLAAGLWVARRRR
jgi:hypothetical protein